MNVTVKNLYEIYFIKKAREMQLKLFMYQSQAMWLELHWFDLLWTCRRTTCCTVEFEQVS